jgi:hypothetical protein
LALLLLCSFLAGKRADASYSRMVGNFAETGHVWRGLAIGAAIAVVICAALFLPETPAELVARFRWPAS